MVIFGKLFELFGFLGENFPQNRIYWNYNQPHNSQWKMCHILSMNAWNQDSTIQSTVLWKKNKKIKLHTISK
jgi:hypothetical protein